ncbi:hypothetical protein A5834_000631, partial [Enterococcus faecium]
QKSCHSLFFQINGFSEVASSEISRNFLKLATSVTTSFFIEIKGH